MLVTLLLIVTGNTSGISAQTYSAPASQAASATVNSHTIDPDVLIHFCDRLVVARVGKVREFDRKAGSLGKSAPPKLRIAQLDIASAPFGSVKETVFVRLPDGWSSTKLSVWPLRMNSKSVEDDWDAFERAEQELRTDPLWMAAPDGPWPIEVQEDVQSTFVPSSALNLPEGTRRSWTSLDELDRVVRARLASISPRTEAQIVGGGPGLWSVEIQNTGEARGDGYFCAPVFRWDADQIMRWDRALTTFDFASMPTGVGSSPGPCHSVMTLSRVTTEGRRSVRYFGNGRDADGKQDPWGPRFESIWSLLNKEVPKVVH